MRWAGTLIEFYRSIYVATAAHKKVLLFYAIGFWFLHSFANLWTGEGFFSLWYPAAGLRLALLWYAGVELIPAIMLIELFDDIIYGSLDLFQKGWPVIASTIIRPVFAYGVTVAGVRWLTSGTRSKLYPPPMPFGIAATAAPVAGALAAIPQALLRPDLIKAENIEGIIRSLSAFTVGDMTGVLIVAPLVLWLPGGVTRRSRQRLMQWIRSGCGRRTVLEASTVFAIGLLTVATLDWSGLGLQSMPIMLSVAWIGMRFGRVAVWFALSIVTALALHYTSSIQDAHSLVALHLDLVSVAVIGFLSGCYADAQVQAGRDLDRRNRLLYQAERLKTLRAMSLSVIHEITTPLSTLCIESRYLRQMTEHGDPDLARCAALIDDKTDALSEMVRRLRTYGGQSAGQYRCLYLMPLVRAACAILAPAAKYSDVILKIRPIDPHLCVMGDEVELTQALVNVLQNAIQAAPGSTVDIFVTDDGQNAQCRVLNRVDPNVETRGGMGLGTLIARTIVEAHAGQVQYFRKPDGTAETSIAFPLLRENV